MSGKLWKYSFMVSVLVYYVKGQDDEDLFHNHVAEVAFQPEDVLDVKFESQDFVPTMGPHEASAEAKMGRSGYHGQGIPEGCYYKPDSGECMPRYPRFYYDARVNNCRMFLWSGCGGNLNRFSTYAECMGVCNF